MKIQWKALYNDSKVPKKSHAGDAGFDLHSSEDYVLKSGESALIGTGIAVATPQGHEFQIRPRSGLAYKHGVTVLNSPGTIDDSFRGEWKVLCLD